MSTMLTLGLILIGLLTAGCVWLINLNFDKYQAVARIASLVGMVMLTIMFIYSIHFVKGADYSWGLIFSLSLGMAIVWLLACGFTIGVVVILSVGIYWVIINWKNVNIKECWAEMKSDIKNEIQNIKSLFDDEG